MGETLIIFGNGFDLDLGWKTSYKDFYRARENKFKEYDGMKYIQEMVKEEYWYDLEGYIRKCLIEMPEERADELNDFWQICRDLMFGYLKPNEKIHSINISREEIFNTNKESCAYKFLTGITNKASIVTFNYTDPFIQNNIPNKATEYIHVHGNIVNTILCSDLILGADKSVMDENNIINNEKQTLPIIKSYENKYLDKVFSLLKTHKNIVFYGHSLGQTDADYFKPYFKNIISGNIIEQNIYFVTKNSKGLQQMKDNLNKYQIRYDDIFFSKSNVVPVYTEEGINSEGFQSLLKLI